MTHGIQWRQAGCTQWQGVERQKPQTTDEARRDVDWAYTHELWGMARNRTYEVRHYRNGVVVATWKVEP